MHKRTFVRGLTVAASILLGSGMILGALTLLAPAESSAQGTCPPVENTPFFTIVYGSVTMESANAPAGTVVEAHSPRGDVVGCFVVQDPGNYGAMYVYGEDDSVSPPVPGMQPGEEIDFYVQGTQATADPTITWSNDKDLHQVDLSTVDAALVADFSASPTSGLAPLTVTFTNTSAGDYDSCLWSFGDGGTSTEYSNPSHQYTATGNYTVSLSIEGPGGSDSVTRTNYITAYDGVVADFTAGPTSGLAPLTVAFTNTSTGDYDSCVWTFGDGGTSTDCGSPDRQYTSSGSYTVSLTVDGLRGTDTITRTDFITVYDSLSADFVASPTSGLAPLTVAFTNTSVGDYDSCTWSFGDGDTSSDCGNPSHQYASPGSFTVTLDIAGSHGADTLVRASYITVRKVQSTAYLPAVVRGDRVVRPFCLGSSSRVFGAEHRDIY